MWPRSSRLASASTRRPGSRRSPCARTRRAGALHEEEEECRLRTPFQRDRDRIVHSKAFRRLKHKTQVFIDPKGDHYRTRLTHTLETAGISRTVARALRLNEDLAEAIALGHDLGHAPFGHTGEEALDEVLQERFGLRFRHNEQSLRVVEVLERDGRGLNLTEEVRDGILHHTGPGEPATLEGKIVRLVDRVAYINHDIDDALRAGLLSADELPREEMALLGARGSRRIDTLVHDLVEASADAGDIVQSEEVGRAMLDLRAFMFERVYLGPAAEAQRDDRGRDGPACLRLVRRAPRRAAARPAGRPAAAGDRLRLGHDRPLRARMALITKASIEEVVAAADMVEIVGARTQLRRVGSRWTGRCPFHEERTPSFSVNAGDKLFYCFGCGKGGDLITFVRETEGLDFAARRRVARRALPHPARVRGDARRTSKPAAGAVTGSLRCSSRRRRSTSATSGKPRQASRCVPTWPSAALARRSAARSGSGSRRVGRCSPRRRARRGTARRSSSPPGS